MDKDLVIIPLVKAQGFVQKGKWKDCKLQRWWTTPGRQCLPDTAEQKHIQTHGDCKHGQDLQRSEQDKIPALRRKSGHNVPSLTKKLFAIVDC